MDQVQLFHIAPAVVRTGWLTAVIAAVTVIALGAVAMAWYTVQSAKNASFEVSPQGLVIRGGLYGRTISLADLDLDQARAADLAHDPDHILSWRTNGAALPGLRAGWFRLKGGGKALVFLTDMAKGVVLPTRLGFDLLLSVDDPAGFLGALRAAARPR